MSGFYLSHLKSRQARLFAVIIEQHLLSSQVPSKMIHLGRSAHADELERDISAALYAVRLDHPELFFLGKSCSIVPHFTGTVSVELSYKYSDQEIYSYQSLLDRKLDQIVSQIRSSSRSSLERELRIYQYLCQSISYVDDGSPLRRDIVGALIDQKAVCAGISRAFACLAHRLGIHAIVVRGKGMKGAHAWNMVSVNGITAHVDATWGIKDLGPDYSYFNLTDEQMYRDHTPDLSILPKCHSTQCSYYDLQSTYAKNERQLVSIIRSKIQQSSGDVQVRLESGDIQHAINRALRLSPKPARYYCIPTQNTAMIRFQ